MRSRWRASGAHRHECPRAPSSQLFSPRNSRPGSPQSPQPPPQAPEAASPSGSGGGGGEEAGVSGSRKSCVLGLPRGRDHRKRTRRGQRSESSKVMRCGFALCELATRWVRRPQLSPPGSCRIWLTRWSRNTWARLLTTSPPFPPAAFSTRRQGCVPRDPCSGKRAFLQPLQSERCAHARARLQQWDELRLLLSRFSCVRLCATP